MTHTRSSALRRSWFWLPLLSAIMTVPCLAQDMRVYTTVTDVTGGPGSARTLSHNLTLFHAGKVYDYMEELGEVVVFEPMHRRFIILGKDYAATETSFVELNHFLENARTESMRYVEELSRNSDPAASRMAAAMRFQLQPDFQETFDPAKRRLVLKSDTLTYDVRTATSDRKQLVQQYLDYADWAARLNYSLSPRSSFPEARLQLDDSLRHRELLPVQVDLTLRVKEEVKLRAEHSYAWEFQSVDRQHINRWEQMLRSEQVRWLSLKEYQQRPQSRRGQ